MATTTGRKIPPNWLTQGLTMAYRVYYLMKTYPIPLALLVNNDQTRVHLVPKNGEKTWEPKGTKHVQC
jgi:hypothetical protein